MLKCSINKMSELQTFRLGGVPEHYNFAFHLARTQQHWRSLGLDVHWTDFPAGTGAMVSALEDGTLDAATLLTEGAVKAIHDGADLEIYSRFVDSPLEWGVHVPSDFPAAKVTDLVHPRIAISRFGSGSHLMACVMARSLGWDPAQLKFVLVESLQGARAALSAGEADVFLWERYTTKPVVDSGEWKRIGIVSTPWSPFCIVIRKGMLEYGPALAEAPRHALQEVDPQTARAFIAARYALEMEDVQAWWNKTRWNLSTDVRQAVSGATDALKDAGQLSSDVIGESTRASADPAGICQSAP